MFNGFLPAANSFCIGIILCHRIRREAYRVHVHHSMDNDILVCTKEKNIRINNNIQQQSIYGGVITLTAQSIENLVRVVEVEPAHIGGQTYKGSVEIIWEVIDYSNVIGLFAYKKIFKYVDVMSINLFVSFVDLM